MAGKRQDLQKRFWSKVNVVEDKTSCWEWTASCNNKGYGQFYMSYPKPGPKLAHRIAYSLTIGALANDICVLHKCDNPKCVRPDHLFLGTQKDNIADCVSKGRMRGQFVKGQGRKLTDAQVEEIRSVFRPWGDGPRAKELADRMGISHHYIYIIKSGRARKE